MKHAIALDIGTTNIQAFLLDIPTNRPSDYLTIRNRQAVYGSDVITRLGRSIKDVSVRDKLRSGVIGDIEILIGLLSKRMKTGGDRLDRVIACGNSAMHHLLLGLPLEKLALAPFMPSHRKTVYRTTLGTMGIDSPAKDAPFIFLPNLGGFVGSDALCVIADTGMQKAKGLTLAIDLGTNGEIILGRKGKILVASTSAGPAFESWHIKCGIPGSDIINVMSGLFDERVIDKGGFMKTGETTCHLPNGVIRVTQSDVREFQLAKAAIAAGVAILRKAFKNERIKKVYVTGVFGSKLNKRNARRTGILPGDVALGNVTVRPKAALNGAKILLKSKNLNTALHALMRGIKHVELHKTPDFQEIYAACMSF
ncbi:MAG: ASKHA domain-containing protein [Candidatus Omnitrophota bacterium]